MTLKIYKLINPACYYGYDECVVVSENVEKARMINPDGDWSTKYTHWAKNPNDVLVEYVGIADTSYSEGDIICASYNAS